MEKSIEKIWKEGFINQSVSFPKIENITELKSIYFIDQFKRKYINNLLALMATGIVILFAFVLGGIPFIGLMMFVLFSSLTFLGKQDLDRLDRLDKGSNSYDYLKSFDLWLKQLLIRFALFYKIWLPLAFMGFMFALLESNLFVPFLGETLMERIVKNSGDYVWAGLPVFWVLGIALIALLLSYFSDRLLQLEVKAIYGGLIKRLDSLLEELEKLR